MSGPAKPATAPFLDIVFDGPPGPEAGRFVEVEDGKGCSVNRVGEWMLRDDGFWALRIPDPRTIASLLAVCERAARVLKPYAGSETWHDALLREMLAVIASAKGGAL